MMRAGPTAGRLVEGRASLLRWWPIEVRIVSMSRDVLIWASQHLATVAEGTNAEYSQHTIYAVCDDDFVAESYRHLTREGTHPIEPYRGDTWLAGQAHARPAWARAHVESIARGAVVIINEAERTWTIGAADTHTLCQAVVRFSRELLRAELASRGAYTFHAACAEDSVGRGLLFCGESGTGKTSLALQIAQSGYIVSGDRTLVLTDGEDSLVAVGFPWSLRVGPGTLRSLGYAQQHRFLRTETSDYEAGDQKIEFTAMEATALLNSPSTATCRVSCIVVVADADSAVPDSLRVRDQEREVVLAPHIREPDPAFGPFWHHGQGNRPAMRHEVRLASLVGGTPIVRLRWDPRRHSARQAHEAIMLALP